MAQQTPVTNPFQLMIDPQVVVRAIEQSEPLGSLKRRMCRPLDRPLLGDAGESSEGAPAASGDEEQSPSD
ncbi:MAG: hypothetical protein MUF03_12075 [Rubrivivax sp.]|jgi:hypothetical protein|nr:hypothetical protein [Rubrivivax sp.]